MSYLTNHKFYIEANDWESLPEMTNDNGEFNPFSCPAQTWSIATLIEAIYEAKKCYQSKKP
jgi:Amylo-alpha-1,6-glucosidase.